ncbi:MAG: amino acid ABC transporter permease [Planctomycetota bacterium]|nr:MAG: amino acid ABC transporter permease [Planctomycetota bacterium]
MRYGARSQALTGRQLAARAAVLGLVGGALWLALARMEYRWDWSVVWDYRAQFAAGLELTLLLSLGGMAIGMALGAVGCLLRVSQRDAVRFVALLYVELVRGTPLLVQLLIAYYCVAPRLGYDQPRIIGMAALGVFAGAYVAEILRAGLESIERGQTEAALALGLSRWQALRLVVGPQALRRVIPPLTGQFVSLVKDSSLLSIIAIAELTKRAELLQASSLRVFEAYLTLAALYLAITFPLSRLAARLERRFTPGD